MASIRKKFDQGKVDKLHEYLLTQAEKGNPKDYEIHVDRLKVVPRTSNADEFSTYENFVEDDTKELQIVIYCTPNTPNNDKHIFFYQEEVKPQSPEPPQELSGLDIDHKIKEKLQVERQSWDAAQLRKEYDSLEKKLAEAEEYIDLLENQIEQGKENQKSVQWGEVASLALEGFIRRNAHWFSKVPGISNLAGVIEEDNKKQQAIDIPASDTNASVKRAGESNPETSAELSRDEREWLKFFDAMQKRLTQEEFTAICIIIGRLIDKKADIQTVLALVNEEQTQ